MFTAGTNEGKCIDHAVHVNATDLKKKKKKVLSWLKDDSVSYVKNETILEMFW